MVEMTDNIKSSFGMWDEMMAQQWNKSLKEGL